MFFPLFSHSSRFGKIRSFQCLCVNSFQVELFVFLMPPTCFSFHLHALIPVLSNGISRPVDTRYSYNERGPVSTCLRSKLREQSLPRILLNVFFLLRPFTGANSAARFRAQTRRRKKKQQLFHF